VLARYGYDFRHGYGWAIPALLRHNPKLKGDKIGFSQVQAARKDRVLDSAASRHVVHPSATFLRFTVGCREDERLSGPSNADLAEAGQGSVLALANATTKLMRYEPVTREAVALYHRVALSAMATVLNVLADIGSDGLLTGLCSSSKGRFYA